MATATKETEITITLVMSEREATFLRDLTQNRMVNDEDTASELPEDQEDRENIFEAIDIGLRKRK